MVRLKLAWASASLLALIVLLSALSTSAQQKRPNILILWGDDIGYWNLSAYNQGMMGYKTPNIDRIAHEGALGTLRKTDVYQTPTVHGSPFMISMS